MKIAVLNGSPKGMDSVTMQYVLFLQKKFSEHEFTILNVCHDIRNLEEDRQAFQQVMETVTASDVVLWAFPLYYLLVHAHYKRFIELLWERQLEGTFKGKYAAILTTSIHFFDHTAHEYVNGICDDLGMHFVGGYSAGMYDLLEEKEQDRLVLFARGFFQAVEEGVAAPRRYRPLEQADFVYEPGQPRNKINTIGKSLVIVTDAASPRPAISPR